MRLDTKIEIVNILDVIIEFNMVYILDSKQEKYDSRVDELCMWIIENYKTPSYKSTGEELSLYYFHCEFKQKYIENKCSGDELELIENYKLEEHFKPQTDKYNDKVEKLCKYLVTENKKPSRSSKNKDVVSISKLLSRLRSKYNKKELPNDAFNILKKYNCEKYLVI